MTQKLTNVNKNCKTYWSLLRRLLNNKKYLIAPQFHENKFTTDFKEKAEEVSDYCFVTQYSSISNSRKLPLHFQYLTENPLYSKFPSG